jgi:hypothetical protein
MVNTFWNNIISKKEKKFRENEWEIDIFIDGQYHIKMPHRLYKNRNVKRMKEEDKETITWANIQTKIVSSILTYFIGDHTFIRLYTYYKPTKLLALSSECQIESVPIKKKDEYLYIFTECRDPVVLESLFEIGTLDHGGLIITSLNDQPPNWRETIEKYYKIVQDLIYFRVEAKSVTELERCHFLCYTIEGNLIIEKIGLSEGILLKILDLIAREEGLELEINRR